MFLRGEFAGLFEAMLDKAEQWKEVIILLLVVVGINIYFNGIVTPVSETIGI